MNNLKTIGPAVAVSLIAHGLLFWLWPQQSSERRSPLEIVLLPDTLPPEPMPSGPPEIEPQVALEPQIIELVAEEPMPEEPTLAEPPQEIAAEVRPLDLERPENWDEFLGIETDADIGFLPFNPDLQARREVREMERKRERILLRRRYEREGLPPERYNAPELAASPNVSAVNFGNTMGVTHIKTAIGCYNLVTELGLHGFETSWWVTAVQDGLGTAPHRTGSGWRGGRYRPLNSGLRFSMKDAMPSRKSSD